MVHSLPRCLLTPYKIIIEAFHVTPIIQQPPTREDEQTPHADPKCSKEKELHRSLGRRKGHISLPEARNTPGCLTPVKAMDEDITWTKQSLNHILMSHKWWESCKQPGCEIASLASEFTLSAVLGLSYFGHFLVQGWWDEPDWFQSFQGLTLTDLSCTIERVFQTCEENFNSKQPKKMWRTGETF